MDNIMEREMIFERAVDDAVMAADRIILEASDGSLEETDLLTARLAQRFAEKVMFAAQMRFSRRELTGELGTVRSIDIDESSNMLGHQPDSPSVPVEEPQPGAAALHIVGEPKP